MSAPLQYVALASVDGYIADRDGNWDWAVPDAEVHAFINELCRPSEVSLLGRRMWEVDSWWATVDMATLPPVELAWAKRWHEVQKVVYSRTLHTVKVPGVILRHDFDPVEVGRWKTESEAPLQIGGATLASVAARAQLLDELHIFRAPVVVGGGTPFLEEDVRLGLELRAVREFENGFTYAHYRVVP
ncbi:dihydrofolate reductase family protein [Salinibacterium sp. ZJ77]|uniref:dihydrofolate reductase family protein n=1 Tax=Salinibacterium sp. ZJ77 TaxID=2708337 RepID=UPI0014234478|nr:dihydrofolate reductase family protein [Salinibacterium sp. ZJ77]